MKTKLEDNYCRDKGEIMDMLNSVSACLTSNKDNLLFYDYGVYWNTIVLSQIYVELNKEKRGKLTC